MVSTKSFPEISNGNQTYTYNIRGWLKTLGSSLAVGYKQTNFYESGATVNNWNGNISKITWSGSTGEGKQRTYNFNYDKVNRITAATYSAANEDNWFNLSGMAYDANGNIKALTRKNQRTSDTYEVVDQLSYTYQPNSNKLTQVTDANLAQTYTSKSFIERSSSPYLYDPNGNLKTNLDKQIASIVYNHLNLPAEISFNTGAKILFAYDAEGVKLTQKVYNSSGALTKTQDYIGEYVFENGNLDYLMHEEGRVVVELGTFQYEYFIKDHLGNVRQVLRNPSTQVFMATMETQNAASEEEEFIQIQASRQLGPEHNKTAGGTQVAWLNADRGRVIGPGRTQKIYAGDSLNIQVYGKYADENDHTANAGSFAKLGAKDRLINDLNEFAVSTQRSGGANPIALFNLVDILVSDLQNKSAPEAFLIYALYDQDSNRYEIGKQLLSRNASNQHEVLAENLYISEDGYMETFVVNETSENVWFDDMMVRNTSSPIAQETHYDPWGLELAGIGFQYGGFKANKYLYQSKELIDDLNLNIYDFHARGYDHVIGRTWQLDPMADSYYSWSPYAWVMNNPLKYMDPTGMFSTHTDEDGNVVAVYDDGDLGVYKHSSSEIEKAKSTNALLDRDLDKQQGFTLDINSFRQGDKINYSSFKARDWIDGFEARMNQGVAAFGNPISNLAWYAVNARNGQVYDPKSYIKEGSQLSDGVYISPRDLGNFAAGATARINGMSKLNMMLYYGAFQISGNGIADLVQNINTYKLKALQIGYPTYGEGVISNTFQRIGFEGIRTIDEFNKNYRKIWKD